jgi:hypothetical protein
MTVTQTAGPAFFKLKSAKEYGFYNRVGQRRLHVKHGEIIEAQNPADVAYFRARPDVMVECTADGTPIDELGRVGHVIPGKAKSFKVYGRRAEPAPQPVAAPPAPKTMQVGKPAPTPVQAPQPVARPVAAPQPAPMTPGERLAGIPQERNSDFTPIEEAAPDGSTRAVRPRVDPGM